MALAVLPHESDSSPPAGDEGNRNYGKLIEQTWIWSTVGYTILRIVIAWGAFGDDGVNIWVFGLIDLGTAWPYAKSIAIIVRRSAAAEWSRLPLPVAMAMSTFFAPYAYLWFAAGEMPSDLRIGMAILVGSILLAATAGVIVKARKLRAEQRLAETSHIDDQVIDDQVIIDLTSGEGRLTRKAAGTVGPDQQSQSETDTA